MTNDTHALIQSQLFENQKVFVILDALQRSLPKPVKPDSLTAKARSAIAIPDLNLPVTLPINQRGKERESMIAQALASESIAGRRRIDQTYHLCLTGTSFVRVMETMASAGDFHGVDVVHI